MPLLKKSRKHKIKQAERCLKLSGGCENNKLIFATELGTSINYGNLTKCHFKPTLKRAELSQDFRLSDLRYSCATLLVADSVNVKIMSERLGYANIKMTSETYTHVLPGMQEGATERMSKMLYG